MLGEPLSVHLPGLVVDQDPKNDHQGSQAAEEGHRVAKKYHREPDQEGSFPGVGHARTKIINFINKNAKNSNSSAA